MVTNDEIIKKYSLNPNGAVEQLNCSLDTLMNESRQDTINQILKLLDRKEVWIFDTVYYPMQNTLVMSEMQYSEFKILIKKNLG